MSKRRGLSARFRPWLDELEQFLDRPWNWSRIHGWLAVLAAFVAVELLFVHLAYGGGGLGLVGLVLLDGVSLSLAASAITSYVVLRRADRRFKRVSEVAQLRYAQLAATGDPSAISELLGGMEYRDEEVRRVAGRALTDLLERVSPLEGAAVTQRSRDIVHRYLQPEFVLQNEKRMTDFACRLLRALPNLGDHESLRVAEKLAKLPAKSDALIEVARTARWAVVELNGRLKFDPSRDTLLRSSQGDGSVGELLRPAGVRTSTAPDELLRAHVGDEERSC